MENMEYVSQQNLSRNSPSINNFTSTKSKLTSKQKIITALSLLTIVLIGVIVYIFLGLHDTEVADAHLVEKETTSPPQTSRGLPRPFAGRPMLRGLVNEPTCDSVQCIQTALDLFNSIDLDVSPCDDFYQHVCGKWSKPRLHPGLSDTYSNLKMLEDKVIRDFIEFLKLNAKSKEVEAVKKARDFYKSCMDIDSRNKLGISVIYKYLNATGLPVVPSILTLTPNKQDEFEFDWIKAVTYIRKILNIQLIVSLNVDVNLKNHSENIIYVGLPNLRTTPRSIFNKDISNKRNIRKLINIKDEKDSEPDLVQANLVKFMVKTITKNNSMDAPSEETLQIIADVINKITKDFLDLTQKFHADVIDFTIKAKSMADLEQDSDFLILQNSNKTSVHFLEEIVKFSFEGLNIDIDPKKDSIHFQRHEEEYIKSVLKFIVHTPKVHLELYLWWSVVYAMMESTTLDIQKFIHQQVPSRTCTSRSLLCTKLVMDKFGMISTYILNKNNLYWSIKQQIYTKIKHIKEAFIESLNEASWINDYDMKNVEKKIQNSLYVIGFPDNILENATINKYYESIEINPNLFLDNLVNILEQENSNRNKMLRKPNTEAGLMNPVKVNMLNDIYWNTISIPMAILNYPVYNLGLESLNYGALGAILGHAIMQGFDEIGYQFDEYGNQKSFNLSVNSLSDIMTCIEDQYNNFSIPETNTVQGNRYSTKNEHFANSGGLYLAFKAYRNVMSEIQTEKTLPILKIFNRDQLFFFAYTSLWCESNTEENLRMRILSTLRNSEDFQNTFVCPVGTKMNPEKKCKIF